MEDAAKIWIAQSKKGRSFRVKVQGCLSDIRLMHNRVPQGSALGPSLFLAYVSDKANGLEDPCLMFADEDKLLGM